MEILRPEKIKRIISREVRRRTLDKRRVITAAREMSTLIERGGFSGLYKEAVALAHVQVCADDPLRFFVLRKELPGLGSHIIINPKITIKEIASQGNSYEGCMSWPYRKEKRVMRYGKIRVEYQTLFWGFLVKRRRRLQGIPAIVFQHELGRFRRRFFVGECFCVYNFK